MEFIECSKGGRKLLLNGFMYTKKAVKKNRIRWECSQRAAFDCKGAVTTSHQVNGTFILCLCTFMCNVHVYYSSAVL